MEVVTCRLDSEASFLDAYFAYPRSMDMHLTHSVKGLLPHR